MNLTQLRYKRLRVHIFVDLCFIGSIGFSKVDFTEIWLYVIDFVLFLIDSLSDDSLLLMILDYFVFTISRWALEYSIMVEISIHT